MGFDANGNFINPNLVTSDIGNAFSAQAFGTYSLGPTLSQDTISSLTTQSTISNISTYLPWLLVVGIIVLMEVKK